MMTRQVAAAWVRKHAKAEFRFRVLSGSPKLTRLVGMVKAHRSGKMKIAGLDITDLGISEGLESVSFWSRDRVALIALKDWFEGRGFETTGVW